MIIKENLIQHVDTLVKRIGSRSVTDYYDNLQKANSN